MSLLTGLVEPGNRTIITAEVSKPGLKAANRRVPDVCPEKVKKRECPLLTLPPEPKRIYTVREPVSKANKKALLTLQASCPNKLCVARKLK